MHSGGVLPIRKRILVGLSGGVDSAVAAILLKEKGFYPIGVTILLHRKNPMNPRNCCDIESSELISDTLSIPYFVVDERERFKKEIIKTFIDAHKEGLTLNPCMKCNRDFKFKKLLEIARNEGISFIATGHYAKIEKRDGRLLIKRGKDRDKDQSYFLALLKREFLNKILFPLGDLYKKEVKEIAESFGLPLKQRPESQELCFLDGKSVTDFLKSHTEENPGDIVTEDGKVIAKHRGISIFTVGQRRGLSISTGKRLYVLRVDPEKNRVIVGEWEKGWKREIEVGDINWFIQPEKEFEALVQVRYRHPPNPSKIYMIDGQGAHVEFLEDEWAPAPGQIAAFYKEDFLLGGGVILPQSSGKTRK